jgi:hypothetical protein
MKVVVENLSTPEPSLGVVAWAEMPIVKASVQGDGHEAFRGDAKELIDVHLDVDAIDAPRRR